jgi:Ca-activated chloride channel family protein
VNLVARPEPQGPDRTLAPYFAVASGGGDTERLPLEETRSEVRIAGVIAQVKVHQRFRNDGKKPIEATYVFPASTRAAVHGMRLRIGARTVEARIERRQAAREQYQQARQQGKRASLLEQERPNVFTMSVANVMPGDRLEVELDYSELLVPEAGVYEFVHPAVVGPRYGGGADPGRDRWIASPYLHAGEVEPYRFGIAVHLETGLPLKELSSPSHAIAATYRSPSSADVALAGPGGGNRDFVLRYRLAGDQVEAGLLCWRQGEDGYFLLMMEPPARPAAAQIPPREYVFLLDISGSMHGFPLETSKALMRRLFSRLRAQDSFNVATFAGGSHVLSPSGSLPATPGNVERAARFVEGLDAGGGTELMEGLVRAYGIPRHEGSGSRTVVLVTDGYVGVEAQAFKFVREHLGDTNLFAFGIGSSVNRALIEGLARAGLGTPFVVLSPEKAEAEATRFERYVESPVLTGVKLSFSGVAAHEVAPAKVPDVLAERPVIVFGKYRGGERGQIELTGTTGSGGYRRTIELSPALARPENAPLRWLWARKWVEILEDERALAPAPELEAAITDLGLAHGLLTPFTSFVAVDSEVVNRGGHATPVAQPLPMPEGVSDLAVGGGAARHASRSMALPAAQAPAPPRGALREKKGERDRSRPPELAAEEAQDESGARASRLAIAGVTPAGLDGISDLLAALEKRLAASAPSPVAPATEITLRLTVNAAGRVTAVAVVKTTDPVLAERLRALFTGLESRFRPAGGRAVALTLRAL